MSSSHTTGYVGYTSITTRFTKPNKTDDDKAMTCKAPSLNPGKCITHNSSAVSVVGTATTEEISTSSSWSSVNSSASPTESRPELLGSNDASLSMREPAAQLVRFTSYLYDSKLTPNPDAKYAKSVERADAEIILDAREDAPAAHSGVMKAIEVDGERYFLRQNETFVKKIYGGGSGAQIYVVEIDEPREQGERQPIQVLRKLMFKPACKKQNREALGEARAAGFHSLDAKAIDGLRVSKPRQWFVETKLKERAGAVHELVTQTRAEPKQRGVIYENTEANFNASADGVESSAAPSLVATFYDMSLLEGKEFAKAIANNYRPLGEAELNGLVEHQLALLSLFTEKQQEIYWQDVDQADPDFQVDMSFFTKPAIKELAEPLRAGELDDVSLELQGERIPLAPLLRGEKIQIGDLQYDNPLYGDKIFQEFDKYRVQTQTVQVHGDLQQTNEFLTELDGEPSLVGLDYRPMNELVPSYAELAKALWGPEFVPGMEGMLDVKLVENSITATSKSDTVASVGNFKRFARRLEKQVANHPQLSALLDKSVDPDAESVVRLSVANQYLRDIRILIPRLRHAESPAEREHVSKRILFDLKRSAETFLDYRLALAKNEQRTVIAAPLFRVS